MDLLDISINIIFPASLIIFVMGFFYQVTQYFVIPGPPRPHAPGRDVPITKRILMPFIKWIGTFKFIMKVNPLHGFMAIFVMHIPLLLIIFLFPPHQAVIFNYFPFLRPILSPLAIPQSITEAFIAQKTIWGPLEIIVNADFLALLIIFSSTAVFALRLVKHLEGEFKSTFGDYFALIIVLVLVIFGYLAVHAHGTALYETYLALHILTASFLIAYIPFSKFFHFVWSYWVNLAIMIYHRARRGA